VHSDHAAGYLAILQEFSKSHTGQFTCHFSTTTVLLSLHHCPAPPSLVARLQVEIPFHAKDGCYAYIWFDTVYMGSRSR
jgi:hypothetical protein